MATPKQYRDKFTLDGLLKPHQFGVTREKALFVKGLFEKAQAGSYVAAAQLQELFTTSDAAFSMAHLINLDVIPSLPTVTEEIDGLMGTRVVKDFNPVILRELLPVTGVSGAGVEASGAASIVPEGSPYPRVTFTGSEESYYQKLVKRGATFAWTWESWIGDVTGELEQMPERLLSLYKATLLADFWEAVNSVTDKIASVTLPDGTTTLPNPALSAEGIVAAVTDIETREIGGTAIGTIDKYIVLIPNGARRFLDYSIAQYFGVVATQDGANTLRPNSVMLNLFPSIEIRETSELTGTQWKIIPAPNSTKGRPVLERLILRGHEAPELRVRSDQGFLPGGGKVGLFEGGFTADTSELRVRIVTGAALWDSTWIGVSDGDGVS